MGIAPEDFRQMRERLERNTKKKFVPAPEPVIPPAPVPVQTQARETSDLLFACLDQFDTHEFLFHGKPIGKPRMTQQDKYVMRPIVKAYWDFKDALKKAAGTMGARADMVIITAWVPMPPSWNKKKMAEFNGQPCRNKPDWDNIAKAVCDALFDEDCCIWVGVAVKYWCLQGQERINVKTLYAKS